MPLYLALFGSALVLGSVCCPLPPVRVLSFYKKMNAADNSQTDNALRIEYWASRGVEILMPERVARAGSRGTPSSYCRVAGDRRVKMAPVEARAVDARGMFCAPVLRIRWDGTFARYARVRWGECRKPI